MTGVLRDRLEALLIEAARSRTTLTYRQVAEKLELEPPNTINQATTLLEELMRRHAETGAPQIASLVISRNRGGLPAPGFFMVLQELGVYAGSLSGDDARAFHEAEKQRCFDVF